MANMMAHIFAIIGCIGCIREQYCIESGAISSDDDGAGPLSASECMVTKPAVSEI